MFAHSRAIREADVAPPPQPAGVLAQKPRAEMILLTESRFSCGLLKLLAGGLDWEDWEDCSDWEDWADWAYWAGWDDWGDWDDWDD